MCCGAGMLSLEAQMFQAYTSPYFILITKFLSQSISYPNFMILGKKVLLLRHFVLSLFSSRCFMFLWVGSIQSFSSSSFQQHQLGSAFIFACPLFAADDDTDHHGNKHGCPSSSSSCFCHRRHCMLHVGYFSHVTYHYYYYSPHTSVLYFSLCCSQLWLYIHTVLTPSNLLSLISTSL